MTLISQARVLVKAISVPTTNHPYLFDAQFCKRMVWGFGLQYMQPLGDGSWQKQKDQPYTEERLGGENHDGTGGRTAGPVGF